MRTLAGCVWGWLCFTLLCLAQADEFYHYQVRGISESRVWFGAFQRTAETGTQKALPPDATLSQQYEYELTLSRLTGDLYEAHWRRWQVRQGLTTELKELVEAIERLAPVYFRYTSQGQLEFFALSEHEAWQRQAIASILYPFQFVCPDPRQSEWRTEEAHPSGQIICRYRVVKRDKDGSLTVNKAVVEVLLSPQERAMGRTHQILGYLQYRLDPKRVILSVKGTLRERAGLHGTPTTHVDLRIDIQLNQRGNLPAKAIQTKLTKLARASGAWYSLYAPPTEAEQERARAESLLRGVTLTQLLQELDMLLGKLDAGEKVPLDDQVALRLRLEAAMVLYPEAVDALLRKLQARLREDEGFWLIAGVLSQSSSEQAQKGLVSLLMQVKNTNLQRGLAQQLTFLRAPHPSTVQLLWEQAQGSLPEEVRPALIMSMANLARRVSAQSPELYDAIVEWCLKQIAVASEPAEQRFWLQVIGALGHAKTMPIIEQHARRGEEITRITAIEALALQPPKDALRLIETLYPIEPSIAVREKMVGLITEEWWQQPQAREFVERVAFQDVSPRVRKACVQRLGALASRFSDALELLVKIAETNSDRNIRREAMLALAALHASGVKVPEVKPSP